MDPVILGLLIFVPLVQVPLVLWLGRYLELDEDTAPPAVGYTENRSTHARSPETEEQDAGRRVRGPRQANGVICWHCGASNDPAYTYCHDCLTALG